MARDHFDISDYKHIYDYASKNSPRADIKFPDRNRMEHSQRVARMFMEAKEADRRVRDAAHIENGREGYYLKILSEAGFGLALNNIDSRQYVNLLNVKEQGGDDNKRIEATVYLKEGKEDWLDRKVDQYQHKETLKQQPLNKPLIDSIEQIVNAQVEDLWVGDDDDHIPDVERKWIEVWFFNENRLDADELLRDEFRCVIQRLDIEVKENCLTFPERVVFRIRANRNDMLRLMAASKDIVAFAPCPTLAGFIVDENARQQGDWANMVVQDFQYPEESDSYLCILDSGVNCQHPMLANIIRHEDCLAVNDQWGDEDRVNHGTMMAGASVYGDLADYLGDHNDNHCGYRLCSVKLLSPNIGEDDVEWAEYAQQAVAKIEIQKVNKRLTFCSAVTANKPSEFGSATSWSSVMDKMSSEENEKRLFVISAGNVNEWRNWIAYPESNMVSPIYSPAQAWNVLTVGACTFKDTCLDDAENPRNVLANRGGLSPFSTTSLNWKGVKGVPVKPEIVMEGGNLYDTEAPDNQFKYSRHSDLEVISTSGNIDRGIIIDSFSGTSPAAALAARYAAIVASEHPEYWSETIRGLFVQTAWWTPEMIAQSANIEDRLRIFGYGVPNLNKMRESVEQGVTFIAQNEIYPYKEGSSDPIFNEMHIYELPWPTETLLDMGEANVRLSITLSYFVEPAPGKYDNYTAYQYASAGLRFDVSNFNESEVQLRNRISKQAREEDKANVVENDSQRWGIGKMKRSHGSVHKDFIEKTAADLATCNKIVVYPVSGWWKNRKKLECYQKPLRYSLIVSLDSEEVECNLITEVENVIRQQITIGI